MLAVVLRPSSARTLSNTGFETAIKKSAACDAGRLAADVDPDRQHLVPELVAASLAGVGRWLRTLRGDVGVDDAHQLGDGAFCLVALIDISDARHASSRPWISLTRSSNRRLKLGTRELLMSSRRASALSRNAVSCLMRALCFGIWLFACDCVAIMSTRRSLDAERHDTIWSASRPSALRTTVLIAFHCSSV